MGGPGALARHRRWLITGLVVALVLVPIGWWALSSLVPGTYSVADMGYRDFGGGPGAESHSHSPGAAEGRPVDTLTVGTDRPADAVFTLTARAQSFPLATGRTVTGYTINGSSPGPTLQVTQGQLVEVHLVNESVPAGITLHWHGVDVPNAEDGVAGVTQDAVLIGQDFVYRFVPDQAGSYWYHSHQVGSQQVIGGLFGALVVRPAAEPRKDRFDVDQLVLVHSYDGRRTVNGADGDVLVTAAPGQRVRLRVVNTDNGPMPVWVVGADYRVFAVDGTDVHEPPPVHGSQLVVTAGGRADLDLTVPSDGTAARLVLGGSNSAVIGTGSIPAATAQPAQSVDLLSYGTPADTGLDVAAPDRTFEYSIGRTFGFVDGIPGLWWSINGHLFPDVPMYMVDEGDVVVMHVSNSSGEVHPMHLHGHHVLVLARGGVPATGSPWWVDSLTVGDGETYDIAFRADNPGIWMDHCHNLTHSADGLVAHLMYSGITEPYLVGGAADNTPE